MFNSLLLVMLLSPLQVAGPNDVAKPASKTDGLQREMLQSVSARLKEQQRQGNLGLRFLDVTVDREQFVIVTGKIATADEARAITQAISEVEGVRGMLLNLGVNRHPSLPRYAWPMTSWPNYDASARHIELEWDDGHWKLDFGTDDQGRTRQSSP